MKGRETLISITSCWLHGLFKSRKAPALARKVGRESSLPLLVFFFFLLCLPKLGQAANTSMRMPAPLPCFPLFWLDPLSSAFAFTKD